MDPVAAAPDLDAVEEKVLGMISDKRLRTTDLMNEAEHHGLSSADVREAVWTLLDDGRLTLSADRRLDRR
ncbi:MAG TPA: hypothetical protein VFJ82_18745 [Longimicrobium sp.]|nr:hypothetical protein [Longimicrobium sp.]